MRIKVYISIVSIFIVYFIYYNIQYSKQKSLFNKVKTDYITNQVENSKLIDYYSNVLQTKAKYEKSVTEIKEIVKNINSLNKIKDNLIDKKYFEIKRDENYIEDIDLKKEKYTLHKKIYNMDFNNFMFKLTNVFKSGYFIETFSIRKGFDKNRKKDYFDVNVSLYKWKV